MAILSLEDLNIYVPDLDLDSPDAAILKAQIFAEGPKGSNRPLEKKSFTEMPRAPDDGIIHLSRWPIDPTLPITVQVRGNDSHIVVGNNHLDWQTIDSSKYTVDVELCQINVPDLLGIAGGSEFSLLGSANYGGGYSGYSRHRSSRRTQRRIPFQVRVTYTAGWDFQAIPLSTEAQEIKIALASVLELQNSGLAKGVKQFNFTDFVSGTASAELVNLTTSSGNSTLMEDYLAVFKKYSSKKYAT